MDDLLKQQDQLQQQGHQVLEELQLLPVLSQFGAVDIGGSFTMGLMAWPDIDLNLIVNDLAIEKHLPILVYLLNHQCVNDVDVINNISGQDTNRPAGLYFGTRYNHSSGNRWKIDIWIVRSLPDTKWSKQAVQSITPEQRLAILSLKDQIKNHSQYRKSITSVDIYDAVLNHQVVDVEGFNQYLQHTGRSL